MQSKIALIGLALANYAIAGPCKPGRLTTSSILSDSPTATIPTTAVTDISTDIPNPTLAKSTTTEESQPIITNSIAGGSFAAADPNNPPSGLTGFGASGDAVFHEGGCYKEDGSRDNGCAALTATGNPGEKRDLSSFASIFQTLNSLSTGSRNKYTVQFFYIVASGGNQACTVSASLGNKQFYSNSLSSTGSGISWNRVLQQVESDSSSAAFSISMSCSGSGTSMIFVDSVFISNQVTPENIGDFKLDFGTPDTDPVSTSLVGPAVSTTEVPTLATSDTDITSAGVSNPVSTTSVDNTNVETSTHPTEAVCKTTCEKRNDAWDHDEWNCEVYGLYSGPTYGVPGDDDDETRHFFQNQEECAAICKTTPGCKSSGIMFAAAKCFFSNNVVTRSEVRDMMDDSIDVNWSGMQCFRCSECDSSPSSTHVDVPTTTKAPVIKPTTLATTTSPPPETTTQPTEVCLYNRGQTCEFNRFKDHSDTLCIYAAYFTGQTWKESREKYPFQDTLQQCAAICQTLEGCESSGYYSTENRCFFTSKKLQGSDMVIHNDRPFDHSVWSHNSCFTCPDCVASSDPVTPGWMCSYEQGDTCQRVVPRKTDALCKHEGMFEPYIEESHERYPDQSSPEKCAAICLTQDYCTASGYKDGGCLFAFTELKAEKFRLDWPDHSRDAIWDDRSCFECPGCTE
ncbi:hypothetical protein DER45DRAFT_630809 [Fusarium avenaceum]|nr:hypothetical protein DER45DRAFT_630809 [Fusarium avenaceum]